MKKTGVVKTAKFKQSIVYTSQEHLEWLNTAVVINVFQTPPAACMQMLANIQPVSPANYHPTQMPRCCLLRYAKNWWSPQCICRFINSMNACSKGNNAMGDKYQPASLSSVPTSPLLCLVSGEIQMVH